MSRLKQKLLPTVAIEAHESADGITTVDLDWTSDGESIMASWCGTTITARDEHLVELYQHLKHWMRSRGKRT